MQLSGLLSFPLTPFTGPAGADGDGGVADVAVDVLREHIEAHLAAGPAALFVACGTGEFTALSFAEYATVVRTAVEVTAGAVPVFAGIGGGPQLARAFATAANEAGADGALLLPPYLVSSTPAGLVRHVRYVAAGSPLPIVVYQRDNARLDTASAVALLDCPTVTGIKDGRGDVDQMLRIVTAIRTSGHSRAEKFTFLNGLPTAELSVQAYRAIGVTSYSSAVLCFVPELATAFHQAVATGDDEAVERLLADFYLPFAALRDTVPGYAVSLVKAGTRLAGTPVGGVRPPLVDPTPEHEAVLTSIVERGVAALRSLAERSGPGR